MPIVAVIESPGKIATIKSLLASSGREGVHVVATYGRLYDLAVQSQASNVEELLEESARLWRPLREDVLRHIQRKTSEASEVWLLTDDDMEGEVIAAQVKSIVPPGKPCTRFRLTELTIAGLHRALTNPSLIDVNLVEAGIARRLCDRAIGWFSIATPMGPKATGETVGRVVSPLMELADQGQFTGGQVVRLLSRSMGPGWRADVSLRDVDAENEAAVGSLVAILPTPELDWSGEMEPEPGPMPAPAGAIITELCDRLGLGPAEVAKALQELYEKGLVSYPRTDSVRLSNEDLNCLGSYASDANREFDAAHLSQLAGRIDDAILLKQGAHGALIPLALPKDYGIDKDFLSVTDRVFAELLDYWLDCADSEARVLRGRARLTQSPGNEPWRRLASDPRIASIEFYGLFLQKNPGVLPRPVLPLRPAGASIPVTALSGDTYVVKRNRAVMVMKALVRHGIGRPSTQPIHADSFVSRFLSSNGALRPSARRLGLAAARINTPTLLHPDISMKVELSIVDRSHKDIPARLAAALSAAGLGHLYGANGRPQTEKKVAFKPPF